MAQVFVLWPCVYSVLLTGLARESRLWRLGNFLVFPLWPDGWVWASAGMFIVAGALTTAIVLRALPGSGIRDQGSEGISKT